MEEVKRLYSLSKDHLKKGEFQKALRFVNTHSLEAIAKTPKDHVTLFYTKGTIFLKLNKLKEALEEGKKCVKCDPEFPGGYFLIGHVYVAFKQFASAADFYAKANKKVKEGDTKWDTENQKSVANLPKDPMREVKRLKSDRKIDMLTVLPYDIICHIFDRLSLVDLVRISTATKGWQKYLNSEPRFWRVLEFTSRHAKMPARVFQNMVMQSKGALTTLVMPEFKYVTPKAFKSIAMVKCVNLSTLVVDGSSITAEMVVDLLHTLQRVRKIEKRGNTGLRKLGLSNITISDDHLSSILNICPDLEELKLSHTDISGDAFLRIETMKLKKLDVASCKKLKEDALDKLADLNQRTLVELDISRCSFQRLDALARCNLQSLRMATLSFPTSRLNGHPSHQFVTPSLRHLFANSTCFNSTGIEDICTVTSSLVSVGLSYTFINDDALRCLARQSLLESINVDSCPAITDAGVKALVEGCPLLSVIVLASNGNISDVSVGAIAQYSRNLTALVVSYCDRINGSAFMDLIDNCPKLKLLDFRGCKGVSNTRANDIKTACKSRNIVSLSALG